MRSTHKPIVVVGSINIDLVATSARIPLAGETILGSEFQIHPGGKGANQAVAVARLGYPVRMVGRLGEDVFGTQLKNHLLDQKVDLAGVRISPGSSGVAVIVVSSEKGENSIVVVSGANALVTPEYLDANLEIIRSAGLVLAQLEIPLETVEHLASLCTRADVPLILDPAPAQELPASLLARVKWFTPNETEAQFYAKREFHEQMDSAAMARSLIGMGPEAVVLKRGSRGAYLATATGAGESIAPFPVQAVDTTAAGDAFNGAFATGLMLRKGELESARFASAAAAISVTRAGAQPSMPLMSEVEEMLGRLGRSPAFSQAT